MIIDQRTDPMGEDASQHRLRLQRKMRARLLRISDHGKLISPRMNDLPDENVTLVGAQTTVIQVLTRRRILWQG